MTGGEIAIVGVIAGTSLLGTLFTALGVNSRLAETRENIKDLSEKKVDVTACGPTHKGVDRRLCNIEKNQRTSLKMLNALIIHANIPDRFDEPENGE
ncbi:MAG: hypothetical protein QME66_04650 [Candidatus Eisenbacteria bacterium]|nr:hypothetical protein [Candidatus Eisenbacteria bacterium]